MNTDARANSGSRDDVEIIQQVARDGPPNNNDPALEAGDKEVKPEEPYSIYTLREKWVIVGIVSVGGVFRKVSFFFCIVLFELCPLQPSHRKHLLSSNSCHRLCLS
ncbi:hypothetical protein HGRIS_004751 [Hohenbuehelia grisea]|uniref:Uncharacterized protein n=1 Tax=Hohenbuehelia grisea TaxID=104357 RepID=A0ABR3JEI1_9AGAR